MNYCRSRRPLLKLSLDYHIVTKPDISNSFRQLGIFPKKIWSSDPLNYSIHLSIGTNLFVVQLSIHVDMKLSLSSENHPLALPETIHEDGFWPDLELIVQYIRSSVIWTGLTTKDQVFKKKKDPERRISSSLENKSNRKSIARFRWQQAPMALYSLLLFSRKWWWFKM